MKSAPEQPLRNAIIMMRVTSEEKADPTGAEGVYVKRVFESYVNREQRRTAMRKLFYATVIALILVLLTAVKAY